MRDHLDDHCHPAGPAWSYTQGTLSAGLTALAAATGQPAYLATARHLADAATTSPRLNVGGILTDPCEGAGLCSVDGATFKGASVRGLGQLNAALPDHPYTAYLTRQATTAYEHDRMSGDTYGQHWAGAPDLANPARQGSAVDLLTATREATAMTLAEEVAREAPAWPLVTTWATELGLTYDAALTRLAVA